MLISFHTMAKEKRFFIFIACTFIFLNNYGISQQTGSSNSTGLVPYDPEQNGEQEEQEEDPTNYSITSGVEQVLSDTESELLTVFENTLTNAEVLLNETRNDLSTFFNTLETDLSSTGSYAITGLENTAMSTTSELRTVIEIVMDEDPDARNFTAAFSTIASILGQTFSNITDVVEHVASGITTLGEDAVTGGYHLVTNFLSRMFDVVTTFGSDMEHALKDTYDETSYVSSKSGSKILKELTDVTGWISDRITPASSEETSAEESQSCEWFTIGLMSNCFIYYGYHYLLSPLISVAETVVSSALLPITEPIKLLLLPIRVPLGLVISGLSALGSFISYLHRFLVLAQGGDPESE